MKVTLSIFGYLFMISQASAQFESSVISVALDNTEFQFEAQGWEVQSSISTTGGSAPESFHRTGSSFPNITGFLSGDKTITFDYRYSVNTPPLLRNELRFVAYSASGRKLVDEALASNTTSGFQTATFYLPGSVEQIQWIDSNTVPGVLA
ncbi:MAG: hypothetical protein ACI9FR_000861 [Cryomorphaceae bacterium]|jgi:hypothetical protein